MEAPNLTCSLCNAKNVAACRWIETQNIRCLRNTVQRIKMNKEIQETIKVIEAKPVNNEGVVFKNLPPKAPQHQLIRTLLAKLMAKYNTQAASAEAIAVSTVQFHKYLRNENSNPSFQVILRMTDCLGYELILSKKVGANE